MKEGERKCHIPMSEDSSPKRDSNPHNSIGGRLANQTYLPLHDPHHMTFDRVCMTNALQFAKHVLEF